MNRRISAEDYLTLVKAEEKGTNKVFRNKDEAIMAYNDDVVGLHAPIRVRFEKSCYI